MFYPEPPAYEVSSTVETVSYIAFTITALAALCYALYLARRTGKKWPILLYGGSFFAGLYEVVLDPMARVAWPKTDLDYYGLLNQNIPLYALPMYVVYFGGAGLLLWLLIDRGLSFSAWCKLYPLHVAAVTAFELIPLHYDIWSYWGYQAFPVGGFPLFWGFANCAMLTNSVAIVYLVHKWLLAGRVWEMSLLVMYPLAAAGIHLMVMMPMYLTLTSTDNELTVKIVALLVCGLSVGQTWIVGHFVATDGKANLLWRESRKVEAAETTG